MQARELIEWFENASFKGRHGDIVLVVDNTIKPSDEHKRIPNSAIVESPITGHAHRVNLGEVRTLSDTQRVVVAASETTLSHEEHATRELPQGTYRTGIQKQYNPEGWSAVED